MAHVEKLNSIRQIFGQDGALSDQVGRFSLRPGQIAMAEAIEEAIQDEVDLVVEAATGTGKTLAYLIPLLRETERAIISTGTLNLQDQLFKRDVPVAMQALGIEKKVSLLKGRANYLCVHRLEHNAQTDLAQRADVLDDFKKVSSWARTTETGDIAELDGVGADSPVWPLVTSTQDNCLGSECPLFSACHLVRARRQAQTADLVVVNHHLLFADLSLKQTGFGEVLPGADVVVIDEAHQMPDIARQFFSHRVSAWQLRELNRDTLAAAGRAKGALPLIQHPATELKAALSAAVSAFVELPNKGDSGRLSTSVWSALQKVLEALTSLSEALGSIADFSKDLGQCAHRAQVLSQDLVAFLDKQPERIRWFSHRDGQFGLNLTPLDIAQPIQWIRQDSPGTWIMTSATLAVANRFDHFTRRLGLEDARELVVETPFDYKSQARLWVPEGLPEPADARHTEALMETIHPLLVASEGRAFLLFTSHRALRQAANWLRAHADFNLHVQQEAGRSTLLSRFLTEPRSILLGAASFWEGVDVPGDQLRIVVIDKLPFAPPDDPILEATIKAANEQGERAFSTIQIPHAVLSLKQGAGRLIRQSEDYGILVLGDPRITTKGYGKIFLNSLPEMTQSASVTETIDFIYACEDDAGACRHE